MLLLDENIAVFLKSPSLSPTITLYHGSPVKVDEIKPYGINAGTRFSKPRMSSFWCTKKVAPLMFAIVRKLDDVLPDTIAIVNSTVDGVDIELESKTDVLRILKQSTFYVYEKTIDRKLVDIGHAPNIGEFTVDLPVKPDKVYSYSYKEFEQYLHFYPRSVIIKKVQSSANDKERSLIDKILYTSHDEFVRRKRSIKSLLK